MDFTFCHRSIMKALGQNDELKDAVYLSISCMQRCGAPRRAGPAPESLKRCCERFVSGFQGDEMKKRTYTITRSRNGAEKSHT
jgi:hypothetical protein